MHEYMFDIGEGSSWLISHLVESDSMLAFRALEAGRFIAKKLDGDKRNCFGRSGYLFVYSCSGTGDILYNGKHCVLPVGTIALLNCENAYELNNTNSGEVWNFLWLRIDGSSCGYYYDTIYGGEFSTISLDPPGLEDKFESIMRDILLPGADSSFRICHSISGILTYLVDLKFSRSPKPSRHQKAIGMATSYIRENYTHQLDIDRLAERAGLSKYYFIKLFKEFMCVAPYEYVIIHRVNEAKKYLRGTQLKISQISDRVGFNDECNFIRTFKRVTGSTPSQYRSPPG